MAESSEPVVDRLKCDLRIMRKVFILSIIGIIIPCTVFIFHGGTSPLLAISQGSSTINSYTVVVNVLEDKLNSSIQLSHRSDLPLNYAIYQDGAIKIGQKFNVTRPFLQSLGLPENKFFNLTMDTASKLIFVTAASANHYTESIAAIARIQHFFPKARILYYDIGLEPQHIEELKTFCNIEYKYFDFSKYPAHVRDLRIYSWKPLIVQDVFHNNPDTGLVWMDASFRVHTNNLTTIYEQVVKNGGFFTFNHCSHSTYAVTHPQMYQFLPTYIEKLKQLNMQGANSMFIYPTEKMYRGFLYWWYLCALDERCQAPPHITRPCPLVYELIPDRKNVYIEFCHRFDQSAMNVLAGNMYNYDHYEYTVPYAADFVTIVRKKISEYDVKYCTNRRQ